MADKDVNDRLVTLGLTTYEAKVFSALTKLGEASVGEIHAVANVPRSAVYGTLEKLERRGIIETSAGRPRRFRALPPKAAVARIESEMLSAVKDARTGLEELASSPHKGASDVRIWIVRGQSRIQERLRDIVGSARSELLVAGTPAYIQMYTDVWVAAKAKKVKVVFGSLEPEKLSELSGLGEIVTPRLRVRMSASDQPRMLFIRADRKVILFASEYRDEDETEGHAAFWTDDSSLVQFLNYLMDSMFLSRKKAPAVRKG